MTPQDLKLLEDNLIVFVNSHKETTDAGIVLPDTVAQSRITTGLIENIGPGKRNEKGILIPMETKLNDIIIFDIKRGQEITLDNTKYILIRESNIFAVIDKVVDVQDANTDVAHYLNQ